MQQILLIGIALNPRGNEVVGGQASQQVVPQFPERAQDVPCPVGIVTIQGVTSTNIRPSEPWIDQLQESNAARCFQLRLGDQLDFRFGIFLIPFIPGAKGLEREAGGVDLDRKSTRLNSSH